MNTDLSEIEIKENGKKYKFDGIMDESASNKNVFEQIFHPVIQDAFCSSKKKFLTI